MCSPSRSPLPPRSPSHPSGSSQCTSPEHLSHTSNLGWRSIPPLIVYLFQCCSLRTSHPCLLPQSLKVCSVHLCLFFCFAYRVIVTIFLNPKETRSERDTFTPMFIAALFIIASTWKQPRCPSTYEWIRKLWYIYTTEYYSAIKKNSCESVLMR